MKEMATTLNKRIIERLDEYECSEIVKQFLRESLYFELTVIEEARPPFKKQYDRLIDKHVKKYSEDDQK